VVYSKEISLQGGVATFNGYVTITYFYDI